MLLLVRYSLDVPSRVLLKEIAEQATRNKEQSIEQITHENNHIGVHLSE